MQAMIRTGPPQAAQVLISMPKTRFKRCAQVIAARRSDGVDASGSAVVACWSRCPPPLPRGDHRTTVAVRGKEPVEAGEVDPRFRHQGRQGGNHKSAGMPIGTTAGRLKGGAQGSASSIKVTAPVWTV